MDLPVRRLWFIIIILHLWVTRLVWPENHQTNWDWGETIGWYHLVPPFFSHRWILYGQISSIRKKSHQDHQISRCLAGKPPAYQPQAGYLTILLSTLGCHPSLQSFSKHPHGLWNWGPGETGETHVVTPKSTPIFEAKSMRIKWRVWFICLYGLHYILGCDGTSSHHIVSWCLDSLLTHFLVSGGNPTSLGTVPFSSHNWPTTSRYSGHLGLAYLRSACAPCGRSSVGLSKADAVRSQTHAFWCFSSLMFLKHQWGYSLT